MKRKEFVLYAGPSVLLMAGLMVFPLGLTIYLSLTNFEYGRETVFVGLANYLETVRLSRFWSSMAFTTVFTVLTTALKLVFGYALALLMHQIIRARSFILGILMVPMVVPPVVGALVFSWMFRGDLGLYDYLLGKVGLDINWFTDPGPARVLLVLHDVWHQSVFAALVLLAGLAGLSREPLEAAEVDGAGWWQRQRYVVLPALGGLLTFIAIMSIMDGFRIFDSVAVITAGGPAQATESLMYYNYDVAIGSNQLGLGSAISVISVIAIVILLIPFLRNTAKEVRGK